MPPFTQMAMSHKIKIVQQFPLDQEDNGYFRYIWMMPIKTQNSMHPYYKTKFTVMIKQKQAKNHNFGTF